ncbi:hypothetical protein EDB89DRAFT_1944216 [Lactarius sanguifluus]|nr:hypothetical protein EDB89DRAFT_1944216 [Lactarius sanguifluus]
MVFFSCFFLLQSSHVFLERFVVRRKLGRKRRQMVTKLQKKLKSLTVILGTVDECERISSPFRVSYLPTIFHLP